MIRILQDYKYQLYHQTGSHQRWYDERHQGITLPLHGELKTGTAHSILSDIAQHQGVVMKDLKQKYTLKL